MYRRLRLPEFPKSRHMKLARLSALHTGRLYPHKTFLLPISVRDWINPSDRMRPKEFKSMKNPSHIRNRSSDIPARAAASPSAALTEITSLQSHCIFN